MTYEVLNKFINRLTDNYSKSKDSNVYKLLSLTASHIQENENTLKRIGNWRDVDQARGDALNRIGRNVQQNRGRASDEVYRVLIKSKIKRNLSNGSINTLIDFLSFILQVDQKEITIRELWDADEHATLKIDAPASSISNTGLTPKQMGTLINLVCAAGIKSHVLFEGTFSFSPDYEASELDDPHGFADDEGTTGGTLGYSYDPKEDYELPF